MTEIDIILPFYNGSKFIKDQLDSINESELEGIVLRFIVVNDASNVEETAYLKRILPKNVLYIENPFNIGVIKSVEKGLYAATAPYIMLCDQDDFWLPQKISISLKKLKETEKDSPTLVYTDLEICGPKLETIHPSMHRFYKHNHDLIKPSGLFHNIVTGCTIIANRKLLEVALPFPELITMHDHWLALCATYSGNISYLNEITILYRQHGKNQIGTPSKSVLRKLSNYKKTFPKFELHLKQKIAMVSILADRLSSGGDKKNSNHLIKIYNAIKENDFFYLVSSKAISGSMIRIIAVCGLLFILNRKKSFQ